MQKIHKIYTFYAFDLLLQKYSCKNTAHKKLQAFIKIADRKNTDAKKNRVVRNHILKKLPKILRQICPNRLHIVIFFDSIKELF